MTINTKFNINDEVWFMYHNKVTKGNVTGIWIQKSSNLCSWWGDKVKYCVQINLKQENEVEENNLFITKEELLKSL